MDGNALVAKIAVGPWHGAQAQLQIARAKSCSSNIAMLARQVSSLAALRLGVDAGMIRASVCGIEMAKCGGAVPVCWDKHIVDTLHEWSVLGIGREAGAVDGDENACAVGVCGARDGAGD